MATVPQLKKIIREKKAGQWWEHAGPLKIGTADVWEIWTIRDEADPTHRFWMEAEKGRNIKVTPEIRFWLEDENGSKEYFEHFCNLAKHLDNQCTSAARVGAEVELAKERQTETLKLKRITLYVASIVFIAAVGSMIVALFKGVTDAPYLAIAALAGVVSSASVLFFGTWQPIASPNPAEN